MRGAIRWVADGLLELLIRKCGESLRGCRSTGIGSLILFRALLCQRNNHFAGYPNTGENTALVFELYLLWLIAKENGGG